MFIRPQLAALAIVAVLSSDSARGAIISRACSRQYTVVSGDTCDAICQKENVSTFQLANNNPQINADCTNLDIGQVLCLGTVGEDCTVTHVIVPGDFCAGIASSVGIDLNTLLANNPNINSDCTNLVVGEVLCVASTIIVLPTSSTLSVPQSTVTPSSSPSSLSDVLTTLVPSSSAVSQATASPVPSSTGA